MGDVKPIETVYQGYKFRSRLEARWAVFFDVLELEWEYEKEGYDLGDRILYLPDFWLQEWDSWVEIKPVYPSEQEIEKCRRLSNLTGKSCLIIWGEPWASKAAKGPDGSPYGDYWNYRYRFGMTNVGRRLLAQEEIDKEDERLKATGMDVFGKASDIDFPDSFDKGESYIFTQCRRCSKAINFLVVSASEFIAGPDDGTIIKPIAGSANSGFGSLGPCCDTNACPVMDLDCLPRLSAAYTAARQARFEYGAKGI